MMAHISSEEPLLFCVLYKSAPIYRPSPVAKFGQTKILLAPSPINFLTRPPPPQSIFEHGYASAYLNGSLPRQLMFHDQLGAIILKQYFTNFVRTFSVAYERQKTQDTGPFCFIVTIIQLQLSIWTIYYMVHMLIMIAVVCFSIHRLLVLNWHGIV